jgi:hypothetical protein
LLVVVAEPHVEEKLALATPAEPEPLDAGEDAADRRNRRRLAVRARKNGARQRVRMAGDELPAEERSQRMAEEDDRNAGLVRGDQAVERPKITHRLRPAILVGEMSEIGGLRARPVAAMVVGVDPVARFVERRRKAGIAGAVLGEAMRDLHDCPRSSVRQPAPPEKPRAVMGLKRELGRRHVPLLPAGASDFMSVLAGPN